MLVGMVFMVSGWRPNPSGMVVMPSGEGGERIEVVMGRKWVGMANGIRSSCEAGGGEG